MRLLKGQSLIKRLRCGILSMGIVLLATVVSGQPLYPLNSHMQQQQFNRLSHQFRCLVCQNEDLASSQASLAEDLREQVYDMVKQNQTDAQIKAYMVKRYGDFVLFKPPVVRRTYLLWLAPWLLLLIGGVIFICVIRKHSRGRG